MLSLSGRGGDETPPALEVRINEYLLSHGCQTKLSKGYGMTELSATAAVCTCNETNVIGSVGIPLLCTTVSAFDPETGEECKYNEIGELCITGPTVMKEY